MRKRRKLVVVLFIRMIQNISLHFELKAIRNFEFQEILFWVKTGLSKKKEFVFFSNFVEEIQKKMNEIKLDIFCVRLYNNFTRMETFIHPNKERRMKKISLILAIMVVLAFCMPVMAADPIKICQVTDTGGVDDKSFNETAWNGVLQAEKESEE